MNKKGYIIHIDFGFILGITPGNLNFESVPFKLTREYVDLMDGKDSEMFTYFKSMIFKGIASLQPYAEEFITLLNIMRIESDLPCFYKFDVNQFRQRFEPDASFEQVNLYLIKVLNRLWIMQKDWWERVQRVLDQ